MNYTRNQVGWVYKKQEAPVEMDPFIRDVIAGSVGLVGVFLFMAALAILPWGVL